MALVEIRDIHKSYEHQGRTLEVLRGIDLTIQAGELVAIVGPSGTGKSTLLHCIGTLDLPTQGEIVLDDFVVTKLPSNKLADLRNKAAGNDKFEVLLNEVLQNTDKIAQLSKEVGSKSDE